MTGCVNPTETFAAIYAERRARSRRGTQANVGPAAGAVVIPAAARNGLADAPASLYRILRPMPNFHALAVFEASGASTEDVQAEVSSLRGSLSHQRVRYYAHEMSESPNASAANAGRVHCMVFVDCDVDAHTEEKAMELAEDVFDRVSTQTCTYLALGLLPGRSRVSPQREEAGAPAPRSDADQDERRERQGRGRRRGGRRGQGRRRGADDRSSEERRREGDAAADRPRPSRSATRDEAAVRATPEADSTRAAAPVEPAVAAADPDSRPEPAREAAPPTHDETSDALDAGAHVDDAPTELEVALDSTAPAGPLQRSSNAMQITVTVKLRASELTADTEAPAAGVDEAELLRLAVSEARGRHPEVPADVAPECESAPLPGGDSLLSLTWKYPAPVPSSRDGI